MKIALLNNLYFPFSHGGAETIVKMMSEDFKKSGQEVFLITTKPRRTATPTPTDLKIYYLNSGFYNLAKLPKILRVGWHLANIFSFKKYWQIKKILQAEKPDLVITHNLMGLGFLSARAIRRLKIKEEHFLHDIQLLHPSGLMVYGQEKKINHLAAKIYQYLLRGLLASPAKVISPSRWLLNLHEQRGFFPNSQKEVRPFVWPPAPIKRSPRNDNLKKLLFVGQIETAKGVFLLIDTFKKVPNPNLRLSLAIRDGGQKIEAAKKTAASDRRIEFLGPLTYEETKKIMLASDFLVVPSLCYENSPTVIYGAQAVALPVIASNLGGIPEIIGPNDKLFEPKVTELTEILKSISAQN